MVTGRIINLVLATTRRLPDRGLSPAFDGEGRHQQRHCSTESHNIIGDAISNDVFTSAAVQTRLRLVATDAIVAGRSRLSEARVADDLRRQLAKVLHELTVATLAGVKTDIHRYPLRA